MELELEHRLLSITMTWFDHGLLNNRTPVVTGFPVHWGFREREITLVSVYCTLGQLLFPVLKGQLCNSIDFFLANCFVYVDDDSYVTIHSWMHSIGHPWDYISDVTFTCELYNCLFVGWSHLVSYISSPQWLFQDICQAFIRIMMYPLTWYVWIFYNFISFSKCKLQK